MGNQLDFDVDGFYGGGFNVRLCDVDEKTVWSFLFCNDYETAYDLYDFLEDVQQEINKTPNAEYELYISQNLDASDLHIRLGLWGEYFITIDIGGEVWEHPYSKTAEGAIEALDSIGELMKILTENANA